jgi:hypothetical protein
MDDYVFHVAGYAMSALILIGMFFALTDGPS